MQSECEGAAGGGRVRLPLPPERACGRAAGPRRPFPGTAGRGAQVTRPGGCGTRGKSGDGCGAKQAAGVAPCISASRRFRGSAVQPKQSESSLLCL